MPHKNNTESSARAVQQLVVPQAVIEGAGVHLRRSIATRSLDNIDPFLLFDDFRSDNPDDYIAGFPMHPHRGIETVTYMIAEKSAIATVWAMPEPLVPEMCNG